MPQPSVRDEVNHRRFLQVKKYCELIIKRHPNGPGKENILEKIVKNVNLL
jgi:hypothetical protein